MSHFTDTFTTNWFRVTDPDLLDQLIDRAAQANPEADVPFELRAGRLKSGEGVYRIQAFDVMEGDFGWRDEEGELTDLGEEIQPILCEGEVLRVTHIGWHKGTVHTCNVYLLTWDGRSEYKDLIEVQRELCSKLNVDVKKVEGFRH